MGLVIVDPVIVRPDVPVEVAPIGSVIAEPVIVRPAVVPSTAVVEQHAHDATTSTIRSRRGLLVDCLMCSIAASLGGFMYHPAPPGMSS